MSSFVSYLDLLLGLILLIIGIKGVKDKRIALIPPIVRKWPTSSMSLSENARLYWLFTSLYFIIGLFAVMVALLS